MRCPPWPKRCHEQRNGDAAFFVFRWSMPLEKAPGPKKIPHEALPTVRP